MFGIPIAAARVGPIGIADRGRAPCPSRILNSAPTLSLTIFNIQYLADASYSARFHTSCVNDGPHAFSTRCPDILRASLPSRMYAGTASRKSPIANCAYEFLGLVPSAVAALELPLPSQYTVDN